MGKKKKKKFKSKKQVANQYADELRGRLTKAEKYFKKLLIQVGINFKTQKIVYKEKGFYISDFFIQSKNLHIELDGGYHNTPEQMEKDKERDEFLTKSGYLVWRMTNDDAFLLTVDTLRDKLAEYPTRVAKIRILPTADEKPTYYPRKKYGNPPASKKRKKSSPKPIKNMEERMRLLEKMREEGTGIFKRRK